VGGGGSAILRHAQTRKTHTKHSPVGRSTTSCWYLVLVALARERCSSVVVEIEREELITIKK
jgi:hypothetical protein